MDQNNSILSIDGELLTLQNILKQKKNQGDPTISIR